MNVTIPLQLLWLVRRHRRRDRWAREHLAAHQGRSLQQLRAYAYAHSPFYQRYHAGLMDRPLHELPVLTKAQVMEHFDDLVTDRAVRLADIEDHLTTLRGDERFRERYWVNATSGTTGRRGLFLFDRAGWLTVLASFARGHEWTGMRAGLTHRMRLGEVASGVPWHMSARMSATLHSPWVPALRLDATASPERIVASLNAWQPEMLIAYPSIAEFLAAEQHAGRLRIGPRATFTSGELLTEEARKTIEAAWGKRLFNQYGATEGGNLAAECEQHRGLHLIEDLVIFEVVDRENRPVPPGTFGDKLLITVLANRVQPLIRYELSDRLRLAAGSCPCGRPFALIDSIDGRAEETLRFPAARNGPVAVNPHLFHRVMDGVAVDGWQIVQEPNGLDVLVSGLRDEGSGDGIAAALRRELAAQGVVVPPIRVRRVRAIPRTATGKTLLIRSNVPRA